MKEMILYLEKSAEETTDDKTIFKGLNLHSFVCLYVLEYLKIIEESSKNALTICFLNSDNQRSIGVGASVDAKSQGQSGFNVQVSNCKISIDEFKSLNVSLPALHIPEDNYFIGGICAVLRHIISEWNLRDEFKGILGHNGGNLSSPAEVSTWTRFVEIDLPSVLEGLIDDVETLPNHLARFEVHMKQPVKIHNIRKRIKGSDKKSEVHCTEDPILEYARNNHIYCEGPDLLLSDLIIYPMMYIIFEKYDERSLIDCIPTVHKWFKETMGAHGASVLRGILFSSSYLTNRPKDLLNPFSFPQDMDPNTSLYKCDPNRSNPKARVYTRQGDIQEVLGILDTANLRDKVIPSTGLNVTPPLDWSLIPTEVHPKGGGLPLSRLEKKCQQLESLYHAIRSLQPKEGDVIVDFCCGAGHLALLIAYLFPQCQVYCVEIKSKSLRRAQSRSNNLQNVTFFQCNMDYFKGSFDIGLSLHACGVATDLVISRCLSEKANFVSCPCCYGSISDNHILKYPRSKDFNKSIKPQEYYILCHAADQTHPEGSSNSVEKSAQGRGAMNVVDSDRLLQALDSGYKVTLSQLIPPSCTPKNNILIGDCINPLNLRM